MGVFDKSFWVEVDEKSPVTKAVESAKTKVVAEQPAVTKQYAEQTYTSADTATATISEEIRDHFFSLIKDKNLPGPDFYEFFQMLKAMKAIPIEETKYVAAFQGLSVTGLTMEKLMTSIKFYQQIVQTSLNDFNGEYETLVKQQVEEPKRLIAEKTVQMQKLNDQLQAMNQEIANLQSKASAAESTLKQQKDKFLIGGQQFIDELNQEVEKINKFIK